MVTCSTLETSTLPAGAFIQTRSEAFLHSLPLSAPFLVCIAAFFFRELRTEEVGDR